MKKRPNVAEMNSDEFGSMSARVVLRTTVGQRFICALVIFLFCYFLLYI